MPKKGITEVATSATYNVIQMAPSDTNILDLEHFGAPRCHCHHDLEDILVDSLLQSHY
jgi:hypothetical protein